MSNETKTAKPERSGSDSSPQHTQIAFVTGVTGFVGANLARMLLADGRDVRVLARKGSDLRNIPAHPRLQIFEGDLKDSDSLKKALVDCSHVYHVAADYRFWAKDPREIYANNVEGTRALLDAAVFNKTATFVHCSTVGTIGLAGNPTPANESTPFAPGQLTSHYKISKLEAEKLALEYAKDRLAVTIVNPSTPIGPWDRKPTPTGKVIVDFVNGKMPAYVETGLNYVHVNDVCRGLILAGERGKVGERYILGNKNLRMIEFLELIANRAGRSAPKVKLPYAVAYMAGWVSTRFADYVTKTEPGVALEAVKMSKRYMWFDSSKAIADLGWTQTPVENAVDDALVWYSENGYFKNRIDLEMLKLHRAPTVVPVRQKGRHVDSI